MQYQQFVSLNMTAEEYMEEMDIEEINRNIVNSMKEAEKQQCTVFINKNNKFGQNIRNLKEN